MNTIKEENLIYATLYAQGKKAMGVYLPYIPADGAYLEVRDPDTFKMRLFVVESSKLVSDGRSDSTSYSVVLCVVEE